MSGSFTNWICNAAAIERVASRVKRKII